MSETILSVRNLRVVFPHRHGALVPIDDISFDVEKGEIIGFVGESGAGKSMTGAAIIGLIDPPGYIERGEIKPLVAEVFPLQNLVDAQKAFIAKQHVGNIVVDCR